MSLTILASTVICALAMLWSILLLRKVRDLRMIFLTLMLAMMMTQQVIGLITTAESWAIRTLGDATELLTLAISLLALVAVVILDRVQDERRRDLERLRSREEAARIDEQKLRTHNAMLVELSSSNALWGGDIEAAFAEITRAASSTLGVERASIWLFDETRSKVLCRALYQRSTNQLGAGLELTASAYPDYFEAIRTGRTVAAHDAHTDSRTSEFSAAYLTPHGITSMLDAPIRLGGRLSGVICNEHVGTSRRWTPEDESFAASLGDLAAMAIDAAERRQIDDALRESEARLRQVIDLVPHMVFAKDRSGRFILANRAVADAYGMTVEQLTGASHTGRQRSGAELRHFLENDEEVVTSGRAKITPEEIFVDAAGCRRVLQTTKIPFTMSGADDDAVLGVAVDITDRKQAEDELRQKSKIERLLFRELDHRVRNNLASLLSLIDITRQRSEDVGQFADSIRGRIGAMASVHSMLSQLRWKSLRLVELFQALLPPDCRHQIDRDGKDCSIPPRQSLALGIVIQELLTNSLKYGSLRTRDGRVNLRWSVNEDHPQTLDMTWSETGGPAIVEEPAPGVGTNLMRGLVRSELRGTAELRFPHEGASHRFVISLEPIGEDTTSESTIMTPAAR